MKLAPSILQHKDNAFKLLKQMQNAKPKTHMDIFNRDIFEMTFQVIG
jgi:hypothetical protein